MLRAFLLVALALGLASGALAATQTPEDGWTATTLAKELEGPVDLVFGRDGTLYYAELDTGNVRAIPPGARAPLADPLAHVDSFRDENGGLLGLAVDPDFAHTHAFFVYYSIQKASGPVNRVSRLDAAGETVLVDDIPHFERHNGGRLVFTGPDSLVVTTGDNEKRAPAQDVNSLLGKTLRMTRDGKPAPDNPDPTKLMYTLGHRNPFGLAYDAENGVLWETENGPASDDEVNILRAGQNYGWPERVGITNSKTYIDPVVEFDKTIGPTGGTVLKGDFYFGAVNDGKVRRVHPDGAGHYADSVVWDGVIALDVEAGPDGNLYVSSFNDITILTPPGGSPPTGAPPVATPSAAPPTGAPPTGAPPATSPQESGAPDAKARIPGAGVALVAGAALVALAARRRNG
ncbi:MAG TPA: PQQ-dependent sugar dehydrogenase [Candidatus Thermoplasmatota archaeon]|nr:PQQ-dependent sugar dehydrogenase [Candidatus Thermoplasmatota archaeon]